MLDTTTPGRRRRLHPLALVLCAALLILVAAGCEPRPPRKDRPVLLIHGWSAGGGTSCSSTFDGSAAALRGAGFTGPIVTIGFYTGDTGCSVDLRSWGSFGNSSSWKEVAKALSHYIHDTYTSAGTPVDVVGYSMGGNIVRGAVQGSAHGEAGFSAPIRVEDAVTLGAPHDGAAWFSYLCLWGQCATLKPGAADINWLDADPDPQGVGGTDWTVVGSDADAVTPVSSALEMGVPAAQKVHYSDVPHTGSGNYLGRSDVRARTAVALAEVDK